MKPDAVQRVTKDQRIAAARVIERLDAKAITGAPQPLRPFVPNGKGEIAIKMFQALSAPGSPGVQDKLGITGRGRHRTAAVAQLRTKIAAGIETRVGDNPGNPIHAERLFLASRRSAGVQQSVAEPRPAAPPHIPSIGPAPAPDRSHPP